jgi:thiamine biosynthesis protein ThiS
MIETTDGIRIRVNGDERAVPGGLTASGLLEHLGLHPRMVVVERNGEIVRPEQLPATAIAEGDTLELVHFVGGG